MINNYRSKFITGTLEIYSDGKKTVAHKCTVCNCLSVSIYIDV